MRLRRSQPGLDREALADVGRRIGEARLSAGLTRTELAERLGVAPNEYAHLESGEQDQSGYLVPIAHITGRSVAWLRGDEAGPLPKPIQAAAPLPEPIEAAAPLPDVTPAPPPEPEPVPEPEHTEEEPMSDFESEEIPAEQGEMAEPTPMDEPAAPAAAGAAAGADDFSADELSRLLTGLSRQRDAVASGRAELDARAAELDERERMLSEREDHIGAREDAVSARENELGDAESTQTAALDEDWHERLQSFEETNRQYAAATTALAEWAAELRGETAGGAAEPEAAAAEEPEAAAEEESSGPAPIAEGDDFPEDF